MAAPNQTVQSSIVGQLQLGLPPSSDSSNQRTPVDALVHVASTLTETVYGPAEYTHEFTSTTPTFVNRDLRLAASVMTPKAYFRMGSVSDDTFWYPWQEHVLTAHSAQPTGHENEAGHLIALSTSDRLFDMGRSSKTVARRGTISQIVAAIAEENGIEKTVIEETDGEGVFIQTYVSDDDFIRNRLLPRALNKKGSGGYFFFFKDGALHFHSLDYQADVRTFDFYSNPDVDITTTDRGQQLFSDGVAAVNIIAYDPFTGQSKEITSSPESAPRMADVLYPYASVTKGALNRFYHLGQNSPSEVTALAQYVYTAARLRSFEVNVTFYGLVNIRIGDVVQLLVRQQISMGAPMSGTYYVTKARHRIAEKTLMTTLTLNRGETSRLSNSVTVAASTDQLTPRLASPGRPLNLSELSASAATKGAESKTSRTVVVPVRDAVNG